MIYHFSEFSNKAGICILNAAPPLCTTWPTPNTSSPLTGITTIIECHGLLSPEVEEEDGFELDSERKNPLMAHHADEEVRSKFA